MGCERDDKLSRRRFLRAAAGLAGLPLVGGGLGMLAGCSRGRSIEEMARQLVVGIPRDIRTFDPALAVMALDGAINANIHDTLATWDRKTLKLVPKLATSWDTPDNGKTWTFHLRKGVKFQDGTDFNASACKFHFDRIMDPKTKSNRVTRTKFIDYLEVVDEQTFRFHMKRPFSVWPEMMADAWTGFVSPAQVQKMGSDDYKSHPVGTGAFKFVKRERDQYIILERNPNYWRPDWIKFEELVFKVVPEPTTRLFLLEQGLIDITDISWAHVDAAKQGKGIIVDTVPLLAIRYVGLNNMKPPFDDVRVRRAANYAINREAICKYAFRDNIMPAYGPLPAALPMYNKNIEKYVYNPDKAKALLREAGHTKPVKVVLWATDSSDDKTLAEVVREDLRAAGFDLEVLQFDRTVYWSKFDPYQTNDGQWFPTREGCFDMFIGGWVGGESAHGFLDPLFRSSSSSNSAFYKNPEVDRLVEAYQAISDEAEQQKIYDKLQEVIVSDAPWIFTYSNKVIKGINKRVANYQAHPADEFEYDGVTISAQGKV
ncbi:MAG: ABC transporter substrate-binding protein [Candidatus Sumerlaeaceae bacterium]|nr:ABC transporter substrate-binding protein [Candidatus Sumerlaeaceae bacterium]